MSITIHAAYYNLWNLLLVVQYPFIDSIQEQQQGCLIRGRICCPKPQAKCNRSVQGSNKTAVVLEPVNNCFVIHLHFFLVHSSTLAYPLDVFNIKSENLVDAPRHCDVSIKLTIEPMKIRQSVNICRQLYIIQDMFLFLCWFVFLCLCYSLFCLLSLVFCHHRVCACFLIFFWYISFIINGKNSTNDNCFAPIIMITLTYLSVYEIYKNIKLKLLHHGICDLLKIKYVTVNRVSLLFKVKRIAKEVGKLNKYTNKDKLNRYFENIFTLSRPCENDSR